MDRADVAMRPMGSAGVRASVHASVPVGGALTGVAILNPLAAEIAQALLDLGGAAHRDLVVAYIAKQRGAYRPSAALKRDLDEAFGAYCGDASDPRAASLLHLPYGPDSHRWALTDRAYGLMRAGSGARTR